MSGGEGHDNLKGDGGNDVLNGGDGNDIMSGDEGNDELKGGDGDDLMYGGTGYDLVWGEDGDDAIYLWSDGGKAWGGEGHDTIHGTSGADYANTGAWLDAVGETVSLGGGDDTALIGLGDHAHGGAGFDKLLLTTGSTGVLVEVGADGSGTFGRNPDGTGNVFGDVSGFESYVTGKWNDAIYLEGDRDYTVKSNKGDDTVRTGSGDDTIDTHHGDDDVEAGAGDDTVRGHHGKDAIDGGDGDDRIYGGNDDDRLLGGEGDDRVYGNSGDDVIRGGEGDDRVVGGSGADGFVWKEGDHGVDRIADFAIGQDWLGVRDYLAGEIPLGGSYAGKVLAFQTWDGDDVALYADTDAGWKAFAVLEDHDVGEVYAAILSGELFGAGTFGEGPGQWLPPDAVAGLDHGLGWHPEEGFFLG